jgi:hypothetical protein
METVILQMWDNSIREKVQQSCDGARMHGQVLSLSCKAM